MMTISGGEVHKALLIFCVNISTTQIADNRNNLNSLRRGPFYYNKMLS